MKIAIAGYGLEGRSNYRYYKDKGDVTIVDEREDVADLPAGVPTLLGPGAFEKLQDFDLVVRTAGLNPNKIKTNGKIWSATNEFFAKCNSQIVGVTGTKGKGTTASLIESILRASGHKTVLVGNIGKPALDILDEANHSDVVVYELSSFQLWDLEKSPQVAVVLMIEPDHLDVHADMDDYVSAKANIRRFQKKGDVCYYHPTNMYAQQIVDTNTEARAEKYNDPTDDSSICVKDGWFVTGDGCQMLSVDALQLPGAHNLENACAAIMASHEFTWNWSEIEQGLRNFRGLDHRLKLIGEVSGVKFYDDSIATTPGSAIAALRAFDEPKVIILGGSDKGADYAELVDVCHDSDTQVLTIGQTGATIARMCGEQGVPVRYLGTASMDEIVGEALRSAKPASVVILSPASASFDMFKSYSDRGNQFIEAVQRRKEGR
jgi:UDP-N-acetylmuramoylalanine--D-glutamate ligase